MGEIPRDHFKKDYYINLEEYGAKCGLESEDIEIPNGPIAKRMIWTPQAVATLRADIKALQIPQTATVLFSGFAPQWVWQVLNEAVYPANLYFDVVGHGIILKIHQLQMGEYVEAGGIDFQVTRRERDVFICFTADDPTKPMTCGGGHHNYNEENLNMVRAPLVDKKDNVFISGRSSFHIEAAILSAYFNNCNSIWVPEWSTYSTDGTYFCAASYCEEFHPGDIKKERA